jgi:putative redox protein
MGGRDSLAEAHSAPLMAIARWAPLPDNTRMICATSELTRYETRFSDGEHHGISDTTADKGGKHSGFRPHDLLEAALATCVNMSVRMYADANGISVRHVITNVSMDRSRPDEVVFRYEVVLEGELTPEQERHLLQAASACPVRRTLSKKISFECGLIASSK